MKANGYKVVKTNIVNDRGIHICKSMLAWKKWGEGATPESAGKKGDHLIGDFYVLFDKKYKQELAELQESGLSKEEAEAKSALISWCAFTGCASFIMRRYMLAAVFFIAFMCCS